MKQWLKFEKLHTYDDGHHDWSVRKTNKTGERVGIVSWHAKWNRYVFQAIGAEPMHSGCLRMVQEFLKKQTKKSKKRVARDQEG